jgi:hypothetical protein
MRGISTGILSGMGLWAFREKQGTRARDCLRVDRGRKGTGMGQ